MTRYRLQLGGGGAIGPATVEPADIPTPDDPTVSDAMTARDRWLFLDSLTNSGTSPTTTLTGSPTFEGDALASEVVAPTNFSYSREFAAAVCIRWDGSTPTAPMTWSWFGLVVAAGVWAPLECEARFTASTGGTREVRGAYAMQGQTAQWVTIWAEATDAGTFTWIRGEDMRREGYTGSLVINSGSLLPIKFCTNDGGRVRDARYYSTIPDEAEREGFLQSWQTWKDYDAARGF